MRINSVQYNNVYTYKTNKINKNNIDNKKAAVSAPIKKNLYPININFTSQFKVKNSDTIMYKDMDSLLHGEVLEVKQELALTPLNNVVANIEPNNPGIDLSKFPLKQRLILKKYAANPNLKKLLEMEKSVSNNDTIIQGILGREISLIKRYDAQTYDKFIDSNNSNVEKLNAFGVALVFLSSAMKKADSKELKQILDTICDFRNSVSSMDSLLSGDCSKETKKLFDIAKEYWYKYELPELMDSEFQKMIYIEEATNQNKILQNSKTYINLPIDEKYYVARYFQNQKGTIKQDDPMIDILSNRTIVDTAAVIREMANKISVDESSFYNEINSSYSSIRSEDGIDRFSKFNLSGKNQDDDISLLNLYLLLFDRSDLTLESDKSKIADFFSGISDEELEEANNSIIEEWNQNYLPEKMDREASFKAYETDVNTQIIKELKQINENLGHIVVKLDNISISLDQIVSNMDRMYAKFENPSVQTQELQQTNALYIEAMKSGLANMTPEQAQRVMQAFKTDGIKYLDVLDSKTTNPQNKAMINNMRQTIYKSSNPMSVVSRLEGYAPILMLNQGLTIGRKAIMRNAHRIAEHKLMQQGMTATAAKQAVTAEAAAGGVGLSAGTIAATAAASAIVVGMYGIYKASNIHNQFSDLYFGE